MSEQGQTEITNLRQQLSDVAKALAWEPPYQASLSERATSLMLRFEASQAALTASTSREAALVEALGEARKAIAAADKETWGYSRGEDEHGRPFEWCVRDELLHHIDAALTAKA